MQLHTLDAYGSQITDKGIKHMHLHTLDASHSQITYNIENGIRKNK